MITNPFHNMDVTSCNVKAFMIVQKLFPAGFQVEGFGSDQALSGENIQVTETRRGIDGKMSAGVINQIIPVTITLEANSPTLPFFKAIAEYQDAAKTICPVTLTVSTPATGETTIFTNGVLQTAPSMAQIGRTLEPTQWVFHFESKAAIPV